MLILGVSLFFLAMTIFYVGGRFVIPLFGRTVSEGLLIVLWVTSLVLVGVGVFRIARLARSR
jgi:hypothetical protein